MIVNNQTGTRQFRYVDKCWTSNGEQSLTSLALSPGTHALSYASSVFEGIRFYNNKPFAVDEHLARLLQSAKILGITDNLQTNVIKKSIYAAARFFQNQMAISDLSFGLEMKLIKYKQPI